MTKAKLIAEVKDLKLLLQQKELIIAQLQKMIFGPTSERYTSEEAQTIQMSLFADLEEIKLKEQQAEAEAEEETINVSYERKKTVKKQQPNRIPLPDHLPRIDVVLKPEGDLTGLVKIGEEVTEILDIIPP
ncbi:MAG: IS66 family transposase, partial [Candidatus Scalindua sp.]|nr:IS66 family transposase [Candidatus Scalindua sp.]